MNNKEPLWTPDDVNNMTRNQLIGYLIGRRFDKLNNLTPLEVMELASNMIKTEVGGLRTDSLRPYVWMEMQDEMDGVL